VKYYDKEKRCIICRFQGVDLHHLQSRGSGGPDESWNLMELCHRHHVMCHNKGLTTFSFAKGHEAVIRWLTRNNWVYSEYLGKWKHEKEV